MPAVSVQTATAGAAIPDRIQTRERTAIATAPIGIKEAVRLTGRNKGTIHKAMTTGKLPFTLSADGIRRIDPAELERVFPGKHQAQPRQKPKKKKRYPSTVRIDDAAALQQRVTAGIATDDEARNYQRMVSELRRKFYGGQLSPESARRFGIE